MSQTNNKQEKYPEADPALQQLGLKGTGIEMSLHRINVGQGDVLFKPGDQARNYLILLSGCVRVDLISKTGRELVLYRVHENQTCLLTTTALLRQERYYARGIAETPVSALVMPKPVFDRAMAEIPDFMHHVLKDYALRVEHMVKLIDRLMQKDISGDLMRALKEDADSEGFVSLTQVELARNIGTAREVIARKLKQLEKQGLIHRHRGRIKLLQM